DFDEYLVHLKYRKEVSESTNSIDTSRIIVTVFTQLERYISKVKFIFALRNEFEKEHNGLTAGEATIRYKNGSTWDQSSVTLSSNYKRPGFNDLYWIPFGNPNLKLERSTNFSIRNKFNLRNSTLELSAFLIQYKDLIQWTPTNTGVVWSPENVPNAKSAGYHLFWEYQSNPVFRISVSLLKNDTQFNDPENNDLKSKSLRYAPEYILSINHSSFISGVFLMSSFKYVSEQIYFYDYPHDRTLPSYRIFNVGLSKKFGFDRINLIVVLNINNLFDLKYQSIHGYPEPGREINFKSTISKK
ncbi:MAG: TonB-dependent receptor domain-containing protein, partial [Fidelibacterota bacterium]